MFTTLYHTARICHFANLGWLRIQVIACIISSSDLFQRSNEVTWKTVTHTHTRFIYNASAIHQHCCEFNAAELQYQLKLNVLNEIECNLCMICMYVWFNFSKMPTHQLQVRKRERKKWRKKLAELSYCDIIFFHRCERVRIIFRFCMNTFYIHLFVVCMATKLCTPTENSRPSVNGIFFGQNWADSAWLSTHLRQKH